MIYTIYTKATGQIVGVIRTSNIDVQLTDGQAYLEGSYNDTEFYVEDGVPVKIPANTNNFYVFDYQTKSWVPDTNQAVVSAKQKRFGLLLESDWTQLPNGPLTAVQQTAWATYRQELRDIPEQSGYPFDVVWPVAPT